MIINVDQLQELVRRKEWDSIHAMLDQAHDKAAAAEDLKSVVFWRSVTLEKQQRYQEALDLVKEKANLFNSQCNVQHELARLLLRLDRHQEALDELAKAPFEAEMKSFYGLAIDAKFFYLYLLAKTGEPSVEDRLSEIPDDYRHITMDGGFLTKPDILAVLKKP